MNRRDFLGKSCMLCLSVAGLAAGATTLSSCSTIPAVTGKSDGNVMRVLKSAFKDSQLLMVRANLLPYDILLVKNGETIVALSMQCTHQDNPLTVTKKGLYCSAHGSRFDLEGRPTAAPATLPLKRFPTKLDNDSILIHIQA